MASSALACAISADIFFTFMDISVMYLEVFEHISTSQILLVRMTGTLCTTVPYLFYTKTAHAPLGPPGVRRLLWARGFIAYLGCELGYISFSLLSLSEANTIYHLRPFPLIFLCWWYLKEKVNRVQIAACRVSFIAFPQILGGPPAELTGLAKNGKMRMMGFLAAFASFAFGAVDSFLVKVIGDRSAPMQVLTMYGACGVIGPLLVIFGRTKAVVSPRSTSGWASLLAMIPCGVAAQLTITHALSNMTGATVAVIGYGGVVYSTLGQWYITGQTPSFPAVVGMTIIITSGVVATLYRSNGDEDKSKNTGIIMGDEELELPLLAEGHPIEERRCPHNQLGV